VGVETGGILVEPGGTRLKKRTVWVIEKGVWEDKERATKKKKVCRKITGRKYTTVQDDQKKQHKATTGNEVAQISLPLKGDRPFGWWRDERMKKSNGHDENQVTNRQRVGEKRYPYKVNLVVPRT